jgi:hypothetical protein
MRKAVSIFLLYFSLYENKRPQTLDFTGFAVFLVPKAGLEPARELPQWILSPSRLPFHHFGV